MKKLIVSLLLVIISFQSFAKNSNPLCNGVVGATFTSGNGTASNPYLICNNIQFKRLSSETSLLINSFKLGADLNFLSQPFNIIGSEVLPFQGKLNGDGYTLANISLTIPANRTANIAPFGYLKNANISNLKMNVIAVNAGTQTQNIGGIAGTAENSALINVQVTGLTLRASNRSGGIIGYAKNCIVQNCSANGSLIMHPYAYGVAGLIGRGDNSNISSSSSSATITVNSATYLAGKVGVLFGYLLNSQVVNVYSQGNIDFTNVGNSTSASGIGGIVGVITGGSITNAFFAGTMLNIKSLDVGGAIGSLTGNTNISNVIWDKSTSKQNTSAGGIAASTCLMLNPNFWLTLGFSNSIWRLIDGSYPRLSWES